MKNITKMKPNRSLAISSKIQGCKSGNIIGLLERAFPFKILTSGIRDPGSRERIFTVNNTLLTMVLTSIQEDKTLKNSVSLYYIIHQQQKKLAREELERAIEDQKLQDAKSVDKKAGRPKKYAVKLPKSLKKDISLNTAAYSKARNRVPAALVGQLFEASRIENVENCYSHWHGYRILIGDGTYVQMQDTKSIRTDYEVKYKGRGIDGYPQGLLEVIIERGTGQIHSFKLSNRHVSELALFYEMIDGLPPKSLLLLDDLYNCFEIIAKCKRKGVELLMPAKRNRNYEVVEKYSNGDEIIKIKAPKNKSKWLKNHETADSLILRRIECKSTEGKKYVLHTTIMDKNIDKQEITLLYLTRWDIEIGIREIKTIMDINVLRSKTPEMALKELAVSLATYNLLRKIIYASIKDLPFSPKEDFIYQFYTANKNILMDKTGRIYNRWSTGRRRTSETDNKTNATKTKAKQAI